MNEIDRPAALPLDLEAALRPMLAGGALAEGAALVYYPIVSSTNDLAAALAERGIADSTIVVADEQIAGRGRGGHTWYSPPGAGLYTSVVVDARARRRASRLGAMADACGRRGDLGRASRRVWAAGCDQMAE